MNPIIKSSESVICENLTDITIDELSILTVLKEQGHSMSENEIIVNCAVRHSMLLTPERLKYLIRSLLSKELIIADKMRTNIKLSKKGNELINKVHGIKEVKKEEFKIACSEPNCPEILTAKNTRYNYLLHKTNVVCFKCGQVDQLDIKLV